MSSRPHTDRGAGRATIRHQIHQPQRTLYSVMNGSLSTADFPDCQCDACTHLLLDANAPDAVFITAVGRA